MAEEIKRDSSFLKAEIEKSFAQPLEKISVVTLVDLFVEYAYTLRASDVHIQPEEDTLRIRYRVDGLLHDIFAKVDVRKDVHSEIISRIKVLAGLRTDEHLASQDGRIRVRVKDFGDISVRVSIVPTYHGENAILRVLAETQGFTLNDLGFLPNDLAKVVRAMQKPYGMILANGPTGSGKTTTLYTILKTLNKPDISIVTIEDPIEYPLPGTTQIQTNADIGFTFATGLRSILRQDPNIIMVGEIRDEETAAIAVNAALTGHLVLSTLHTNDAATTFPRLLDMGVPPFLVASTLNVAMGQRLVRVICDKCKHPRVLNDVEAKSLAEIIPEAARYHGKFFEGKGCPACNGTGYVGRAGIREVLEVNEEIRQLVMNRANARQIKEAAIRGGMTTMIEDALERASRGVTTISDILRLIHE